MADQQFQAVVDVVNGMEVHSHVRDFTFVMDEPTSVGGTNKGMNPIEALLSALGGCKAIVIQVFARARKMKINKVSITVDGTLDPDGHSGKNPSAKVGLSKIKTTYHIEADNSPEEIQDFVDFVEKTCPVLDSIVNAPVMEVEID
ncbi:OsmC family peroxiredoxin [Aerococcus loyolae]|uniref:OsmC family peroxiredoxin n=1 Tax=Aerococcus urinae TaxID=1376 RepID=A0A2I1L6T9_9LACT|nr:MULTISPECIES: OsmC family protein [Aerococcus]MCY3067828.1 OsmC family protein [Aerococcus mictus]MCY3080641.1 OsmC family protein [Aerococcus mictus]MDK6727945.1 OsmC family protein [Aerococcus urinae]MDK7910226.1 OsmC family protein [Aerococcus urinae]MDK8610038.1 OsmC family protein [Aerococcus urinae]